MLQVWCWGAPQSGGRLDPIDERRPRGRGPRADRGARGDNLQRAGGWYAVLVGVRVGLVMFDGIQLLRVVGRDARVAIGRQLNCKLFLWAVGCSHSPPGCSIDDASVASPSRFGSAVCIKTPIIDKASALAPTYIHTRVGRRSW